MSTECAYTQCKHHPKYEPFCDEQRCLIVEQLEEIEYLERLISEEKKSSTFSAFGMGLSTLRRYYNRINELKKEISV